MSLGYSVGFFMQFVLSWVKVFSQCAKCARVLILKHFQRVYLLACFYLINLYVCVCLFVNGHIPL